MAKKHKKLNDKEILVALETCISEGVGLHDSELAKERTDVQEFYDGDKPLPSHKGNSKFVSQDVFDSVESMKATLLETFSAGTDIVKFAPQGEEDVEPARIASEYADYVVFRQNNGYEVFHDVIHDGLTARIGVAKVYWHERVDESEETFEDATIEDLDFLLAEEDVEPIELSVDEETGLFSGTIVRKEDMSQVVIEQLPPEEFIVEPKAKKLCNAFCAHRTRKSRSDLLKEGYSKDLIDKIAADGEGWETDPEVLARFEKIGAEKADTEYQEQVQKIWVYECYIDIDLEGTGRTKLWKITKAGNVVLDKEQVRRRPFLVFTPLRRPHAIHGSNYAKKVVSTQNAKTVLTRGILDHTVTTNNPRYKVVNGSLKNPRELMDNRVGGIVNVTRPDGILPLEQASLNPFVFQTLQLLDTELEDTTGVSRLSQGVNKDAISKQNSAAMIEQLASMSQQRQKIIARNFANQFVKELWLLVYELVLENEKQERIVELAGNYVRVDPKTWRQRRDVTVQLHLGYGERDREAEKYFTLDQLLSADPTAAPLRPIEKKYNLLKKGFELRGVKNVNDYLLKPEEVPPPEPDPMVVHEMEMAKAEMEIRKRQQMLAEAKFQIEAEERRHKMRMEERKLQTDFALKSDKQDLDERAQEHKEHVDNAELEIAKKATDVRAIASPTG